MARRSCPAWRREQSLVCPFCVAAMILSRLSDRVTGLRGYGWCCQQCGRVVDSLIDLDRCSYLEPKSRSARLPRPC